MAGNPNLRRFEELIRARSGLSMRPQEAVLLEKTLAVRQNAHRLRTAEEYLAFLSQETPDSATEWSHLFVLLTNQETYFFRDPGQLSVLKHSILPDIIRRQQATRSLRIWSAGCSTGEEPYSLAMMLQDVLPPGQDWKVFILGTDISEAALEKARLASYGNWSFRSIDAQHQQRFFRARGNKWEVLPQVRRDVKFASGNLLRDDFPSRSSEIHDMDLIICRNVFIYFSRDAVGRVLAKMARTLRQNGYLLTGHAEVHNEKPEELSVQAYPQTVVYQRSPQAQTPAPAPHPAATGSFGRGQAFSPPPPASWQHNGPPSPGAGKTAPSRPLATGKVDATPPPVAAPPRSTPARSTVEQAGTAPSSPNALQEAAEFLERGRHREALQLLGQMERQNTPSADGDWVHLWCLQAQAQANLGQLEAAEEACRKVHKTAPLESLPYLIRARIAEERGDYQAARELLKRVLYLNPNSVRACLQLAQIYAAGGETNRARQSMRAAWSVLDSLADSAAVPKDPYAVEADLTVGALKKELQESSI